MTLQPEDLAPCTSNDLVLRVTEGANEWGAVPLAALPAHATTHQNGGSDEINVGGLSGVLAEPQTPILHAATHQNGGADEISVAGLSGLLADSQTPSAHAASHKNGGSDEVSTAIPAASVIPKSNGLGKLDSGWISEVLAITDMTDVTAKTGSGTVVVMSGSPEINEIKMDQVVSTGSGNPIITQFTATGSSDVNYIQILSAVSGVAPQIAPQSGGGDPDVSLNVVPSGTGTLQQNGVPVATTTGVQTLTNKDLTTPTVASFTNAQHDHSNAAGGGALGAGSVSLELADLTDVTAVTGTGTVVVMQDSPDLTTPTIASFANAVHDHSNAPGGGALADNIVTFAKMQNSAAAGISVVGKSAAGAGDFEEIAAASNNTLLARQAGVLGFAALNSTLFGVGTIATTNIADGNVTLAKLANVPTQTVVGRGDAGSGVPSAVTFSDTGIAISTGEVLSISGRYLNTQYLTSGTTYTPTAGTATAILFMQAAGGGAGGAGQVVGQSSAGGGGGHGSWLIRKVTGVTGTYAYALGAIGTGGAAGANGTDAANTTFTNGATTYTAFGGGFGAGMAAGTAALLSGGGNGGALSTNGDVNSGGNPGFSGTRLSATVAAGGNGGASPLGSAGKGRIAESAGDAALGYGAGGAGATCLGTTGRAGGNGAPAIIIVTECR